MVSFGPKREVRTGPAAAAPPAAGRGGLRLDRRGAEALADGEAAAANGAEEVAAGKPLHLFPPVWLRSPYGSAAARAQAMVAEAPRVPQPATDRAPAMIDAAAERPSTPSLGYGVPAAHRKW